MKFRVKYRNEYLNPSDVRIDGGGEVRRAVNYLGGRTWLDITDNCIVEWVSDIKDKNGVCFAVGDTIKNANLGTGEIRFVDGAFVVDYGENEEYSLYAYSEIYLRERLEITGTIHDQKGKG